MNTTYIALQILIVALSFISGYAYQKRKERKACENCEIKLRAKSLWFRLDGEWNHLIINSDFSVTLNGEDCTGIANIMCFDKLLNGEDKIEIYNATKGFELLPDDLKKAISFTFDQCIDLS